MLNERTLSIATANWAGHFGCPVEELFAEPFRVVIHGAELADYSGVFALFRGGCVIVSMPPDRVGEVQPLLAALPRGCAPDGLAAALCSVASAVIGPAYIGYAAAGSKLERSTHAARALGPEDVAAVDALEEACDPTEWEHGGSAIGHPCSGVFVEGQIAALAGYEVWGGTIAHISVVTHPGFRGRGFGGSVVAHVAKRAIVAGLVPQYRTLQSNVASIRVAERLGFEGYAVSLAVRLGRG